jgi:hypothetical protein
MMTGVLAASGSHRFLVEKAPLTSSQVLPPPTLYYTDASPYTEDPFSGVSPSKLSKQHLETSVRMLKKGIQERDRQLKVTSEALDGANAQLVIQNMYCLKQNEVLHKKENPKRKDKTRIPEVEGKGCHWTDREVIDQLLTWQQVKEKEARAAGIKKSDKKERKEKRLLAEKEWNRIIAVFLEEHDQWKKECGHLKKIDPNRRDPPKRELKRDVFMRFGVEMGKKKGVEQHDAASSSPEQE